MKIKALVENKSSCELTPKHGLSLYIETESHKILFDLGPDKTLFSNARTAGIHLEDADTVIISHGHFDHGGALKQFLKINKKAVVYIQRSAFEPHYNKAGIFKIDIGLDRDLINHPQIKLIDGDYQIDDELQLFTVAQSQKCRSPMNDVLYDKHGKDDFTHEQNLIISGEKTVLVFGCGHTGIVNILESAKPFSPTVCVGGFHLFNPVSKRSAPKKLLDEIACELKNYGGIEFYTCHCTGSRPYKYLSEKMSNLHYLSCGEQITL